MIDNEILFKCDMCPKAFATKAPMLEHRKKHTAFIMGEENSTNDKSNGHVAKLKCPECGVPKRSNQGLNYHLIAIHKYETGEFTCNHCDKVFNMENKLKYHQRCMHGPKEMRKCDICEKEVLVRNYRVHYKRHDPFYNTECRICGKPFTNSHEESIHLVSHNPRSIQCTVCTKLYRSEALLQKHHKRIHSESVFSFKCDHCNKDFRELGKKKSHVAQTHRNIRNYPCHQCDKTFKRQAHLTLHITSIHSDSRPFACSQCESTFKFSRTLKLHMMTHTGEKPYKCDQCDKDFRQLAHLKSHKSDHHSSSSFLRTIKCNLCDKSYKSKNALQYHIESKHEQKIFSCKHCDKTFKTSLSVKDHNRRLHSSGAIGQS